MFWWKYSISVWWSRRQEGLDVCADKLLSCLNRLRDIDDVFSDWLKWDLEGERVPITHRGIKEFLKSGAEQDFESSRLEREQFGYKISLNTGSNRKNWIAFHLLCDSTIHNCPNHVQLSLPESDATATLLKDSSLLAELLSAIAVVWKPDWGCVSPIKLFSIIGHEDYNKAFVGWLTYLPCKFEIAEKIQCDAQVLPVNDYGAIFITMTDKYNLSNPQHISATQRLIDALNGYHLL